MSSTIRVDLHVHSDRSDGQLPPEALAQKLADAGVLFASLTDHDRLDGYDAFRAAFARAGGVAIPGVEVTARFYGREIHVLGYGFDSSHPAIRALMKANPPFGTAAQAIHSAGGLVFLAHPLQSWVHAEDLESDLQELKDLGLDGIEAHYSSYPVRVRQRLARLAGRFGLLTCAGSDYHGATAGPASEPGVDLPAGDWSEFRNALPVFRGDGSDGRNSRSAQEHPHFAMLDWRVFALRILFPAFLTVGLFVAAMFGLLLPSFEENLMGRKREMIRELTNSAWSVLDFYARQEREGRLTREQAQQAAAQQVKNLRYGSEGKDYFWITDLHPRMVMHPYRPDLNGQDLSNFRDPRGVRIFVEFVTTVRKHDHGYLEYVWQWKDDPDRLEPKESYVRAFQPWGWIIGTGIYVEDVKAEIKAIERRLVNLSVLITVVIGLLLLFLVLQSLRIERGHAQAEYDLRESREKYRTLAEASTEGALLLIERRCGYANQAMLEMCGYTQQELPLLDVYDLFPPRDGAAEEHFADRVLAGDAPGEPFETRLKRKDGTWLDVLVAATPIETSGRPGIMILARDLSRDSRLRGLGRGDLNGNLALLDNVNIGVFRASAEGEWPLIQLNPAARRLMGLLSEEESAEAGLVNLIALGEERDRFFHRLKTEGSVKDTYLQLRRPDGTMPTVAVSAILVGGDGEKPPFCDGILEDVTERRRTERERTDLIVQLQTSLLFLTEPVKNSIRPLVSCPLSTPVGRAARMMSDEGTSAIVAVTDEGDVAGILTDRDFRGRVVAEGMSSGRPVVEVMTAPVVSVSEDALVYEALLLMRQRGVSHLLVRDPQDRPAGILRDRDLIRFDRYSAAVLTGEIHRASSPEEVAEARGRLPVLVESLIASGARPRGVARTVTAVSDAATERPIGLAFQDLGEPALRFAFVALGSEGREEQTLATDQDNAIIYDDPPAGAEDEARRYFQALGGRVCGDLARAGYALCTGEAMASNPKWCQPLSQWKRYFSHWVEEPNPEELFHFSIFFDFRCVFGDTGLVQDLRDYIQQALRREPAFFFHLARNALKYRMPIGMFGQIVTTASDDSEGVVNLKDATMPIVHFARLYALLHGLPETNTAERLQVLGDSGVLRPEDSRELLQAYEFLMLLRYRVQASAIARGEAPGNFVDPRSLTHLEVTTLKQAFSQVAIIQKKIEFDFPGAA